MSDSAPAAIVLLSGGLDSATTLAIARHEGFRPFALTFRYGQRHRRELAAASAVAAAGHAARHLQVAIDLAILGGSALTGDLEVPKHALDEPVAPGIPVTYVPARNTVFLAYALAWAETIGAWDIYLGVNAVDYSGYPDCRPDFVAAFESLANLATKAGVEGRGRFRVHTPLIQLSKAQIIRRGIELGVDYSLTHSCYDPTPEGLACGQCDSCRLRLRGFREAGVTDPVPYHEPKLTGR